MKKTVIPALFLLLTLTLSPVLAQEAVKLEVYEDGYVKVEVSVVPPNGSAPVVVPLCCEHVQDLQVEDPSGNPLAFDVVNGSLFIEPDNASVIVISYYTPDLTSKRGILWSLNFSSAVPFTVVLPKGSIVVDLSAIPLRINGTSITLPPGNQSISYVIQNPPRERQNGSFPYIVGALIAGGIAGASVLLWRGRKKRIPTRDEFIDRLSELDLRDEERMVLMYLYDRGGRASQAEVRDSLGIPKTTAWRMFKRLEERGLLRIIRGRKEYWLELKF